MKNSNFTIGAIIGLGVLFWIVGINGEKETRKAINYFLLVLLASMLLIRWDDIRPMFFKSGTTTATAQNGGGNGGLADV